MVASLLIWVACGDTVIQKALTGMATLGHGREAKALLLLSSANTTWEALLCMLWGTSQLKRFLSSWKIGILREGGQGVLPMLAVRSHESRMTFAHVGESATRRLVADLDWLGLRRLVFKSDQEPAILALEQA